MALKDICCLRPRGKHLQRDFWCPENAGEVNPYSWNVMGNIESFEVTPNVEEIDIKDYQTCVGGLECTSTTLESVNISLTSTCFNKQNTGLGFGASSDDLTAAAVTGELHTYQASAADGLRLYLVPEQCMDPSQTVVVTNNTTAAVLVEGVDYILGTEEDSGVIYLLNASTNLNDGDEIALDYTTVGTTSYQPFVNASKEVSYKFLGLDCVSGKKFWITFYRVSIISSETISLIDDDFARITFNGKLLKDPTILTGSPYGRIDRVI